ncbi:class IIb bacteriocin, lactobin A/cerein 7B family [Chitinimonas sp. BJB300]|uniref:class IIb bacteriocin, lactobin A/cerein 7B family n=1 Tax=Chitinimonas sp. BJB300 TaxID=1559339 RepID=UPI000C10500B|nr:class IIb bacteriocin, lactobin A/cerein 7B family [Chitinimonas sp. BJB300]PHV13040.1 hypothetical protein CSQ89_02385 [Chitinimonas sp. BJB300]TSJ87751.1 class IIb bacteriocin, lactobin A/cerein 7B family [Chitinimonas sp. BJB300]
MLSVNRQHKNSLKTALSFELSILQPPIMEKTMQTLKTQEIEAVNGGAAPLALIAGIVATLFYGSVTIAATVTG